MKRKPSADVNYAKTGRNLEEIMITRGNALVLKFDEKDKSERVKWFVEHKNERKGAPMKWHLTLKY